MQRHTANHQNGGNSLSLGGGLGGGGGLSSQQQHFTFDSMAQQQQQSTGNPPGLNSAPIVGVGAAGRRKEVNRYENNFLKSSYGN
jgi:hypothetical protein